LRVESARRALGYIVELYAQEITSSGFQVSPAMLRMFWAHHVHLDPVESASARLGELPEIVAAHGGGLGASEDQRDLGLVEGPVHQGHDGEEADGVIAWRGRSCAVGVARRVGGGFPRLQMPTIVAF
jgi:hypothetical protein